MSKIEWTDRVWKVRFLPERLAEPLRWRKPQRVFVNSMSDLFHEGVSDEQIAAVFGVMAACPRHTFQVLTKRPERAAEWFRWLEATVRERLADAPPRETPWVLTGADHCTQMAMQIVRPPKSLMAGYGARWPLPNVHLGVSVEDQATADERIPLLLQCPAAVRWVSYEPALGPIDFGRVPMPDAWQAALDPDDYRRQGGPLRCHADGIGHGSPRLDWIVIGGESGPGARTFDLAWARSTIAQCRDAGVPCFVKQLGSRVVFDGHQPAGAWWPKQAPWPETPHGFRVHLENRKGGDMSEWPADIRVREMPGACEEVGL